MKRLKQFLLLVALGFLLAWIQWIIFRHLDLPIIDSWLEGITGIAAFLCFLAAAILPIRAFLIWLEAFGRRGQPGYGATLTDQPEREQFGAPGQKTTPGSGYIGLDWSPPES